MYRYDKEKCCYFDEKGNKYWYDRITDSYFSDKERKIWLYGAIIISIVLLSAAILTQIYTK